ncbi:MAG: glycoside hydrolase family 13 protein [Clostridia bacterium]|nr:glycoside hydrolase family 13 protein [Clostridia bacterium]
MTAFDDTKTWHKSITGAVAAGDPVRLRLVLPRSFGVFRCALRLQADGKEADTIPMEWESTDDRDEWWGKEISLPCGLYFYWFEFETGWGVTVLKKQASSRCAAVDGTELWQLTVYDAAFQTPDCFKGGVIYQIFPDRFFASGKPKTGVPQDRVLHTDLHDLPVYKPDTEGKITNNDYFGGDLEGIRQKLPYIAGLGADILYLNPIFEAHSNHRYNTANYLKIDPLLGTEADFAALCKTAHGLGVKVILDGVFSHTGDDSIYFNKYGRYPAPGAWQRAGSPYDSWYRFRADGSYACWWNIDTLPEVNEEDPAFTAFITGEGGVIDKWLSLGADGFRLDVADELPDAFLDAVRTAVKRNGEEKLLLGEVWEDASNKISHGGRRRYFDGRQLDGVMNYPFRNAVLRFALTGDAPRFMDAVYSVVLNYPPQAMNVCMNLLGSHDTQRILTALTGVNVDRLSRGEQADLRYTPAQLAHAKKLLKLANIVNYALPGIPSLFYGDEAGMLGAKDPFNRAFFPWGEEDTDLQDFFRLLGKIRKDHDVLQDGGFYPLSATLGCIAFLRYAPGKRRLAVISNKNPDEIRYVLNTDMRDMACIYGGTKDGDAVIIPSETAVILTD